MTEESLSWKNITYEDIDGFTYKDIDGLKTQNYAGSCYVQTCFGIIIIWL